MHLVGGADHLSHTVLLPVQVIALSFGCLGRLFVNRFTDLVDNDTISDRMLSSNSSSSKRHSFAFHMDAIISGLD